jgi:hypothetical protein
MDEADGRRQAGAGAGDPGAGPAPNAANDVPTPNTPPAGVSPELLAQLAQYAGYALPPERAALLAPLLAGPLATLRAVRPDDYDDLQPASVYRVPREA